MPRTSSETVSPALTVAQPIEVTSVGGARLAWLLQSLPFASGVDYCNGVLYGILAVVIGRLQMVHAYQPVLH